MSHHPILIYGIKYRTCIQKKKRKTDDDSKKNHISAYSPIFCYKYYYLFDYFQHIFR